MCWAKDFGSAAQSDGRGAEQGPAYCCLELSGTLFERTPKTSAAKGIWCMRALEHCARS